MVCHQCNRRYVTPKTCPQCWSKRIKFFGIGTQRVEEDVHTLFPSARTLRWDRDVTQGKIAHELILDRFTRHEADVLIGTQMIAKGLDLPLVTLVGVVSADTALHLPDFRSGERTFQLLTQVAGRAGRSGLGGRVIIQTYTPEHYAIQAASRHDYKTFVAQELASRAALGYPPYSRLARLVLQHSAAGQGAGGGGTCLPHAGASYRPARAARCHADWPGAVLRCALARALPLADHRQRG